eukprot:4383709-Prymnesium_polylepis.2
MPSRGTPLTSPTYSRCSLGTARPWRRLSFSSSDICATSATARACGSGEDPVGARSVRASIVSRSHGRGRRRRRCGCRSCRWWDYGYSPVVTFPSEEGRPRPRPTNNTG